MKAALIIMTILGCDDSATQCHYIDTVQKSWQTVALCDAQAETHINSHQNSNYPVIVAVCESSGDRMTAEAADIPNPGSGTAQLPQPDATVELGGEAAASAEIPESRPGLTSRTLALVRKVMPDTASLKSAVSKPVHYVEDGYSWVVRKFAD
jgi:hypothetical protein